MQHDYRYVTRREANVVKNELIEILNKVQDIVRPHFTFRYWFIGSSSRNMITYDANGNQGYDFDINIEPHYDNRKFKPEQVKRILRLAFDQVVRSFGYSPCEDSTRVLTFKFKDTRNSRVLHSCDVAIVNDYEDEQGQPRQEYIHFNKQQRSYDWADQPKGFYKLDEKYEWIKKSGYAEELQECYLYKKDTNTNADKRSRSLFAEAVNEICVLHKCKIR